MVQGTTSDAGKSTLVAALCRIWASRGISVAPFKPQNMALNSAVTVDGGEIGRAQAVQALAAGIEPHTDMNPVLLKPSSDVGAQVIIHGKVHSDMNAMDYHQYKTTAMAAVLESYRRLQKKYQAVIIEGAGSPAEINLRDRDIANMGFAEAVDCPVIIIADIDKGGVFAHLVGTLDLLSASEQNRVVGFVINRFRGDIALLQPGLDWLEKRTGKPVLGVIPYLHHFHLEAEDAIQTQAETKPEADSLKVTVPVLPKISNHTDFDALQLNPQVELQFIDAKAELPASDLIILPGSKSVRSDLQYLLDNGWQQKLDRHLRYGGKLMGICGGYQMLGQCINDSDGVEGRAGSSRGFAYLQIETELLEKKQLHNRDGVFANSKVAVSGYEIHQGQSYGPCCKRPVFVINGQDEGCYSEDNQIMGSYLHGLFDRPEASQKLLGWAGLDSSRAFGYQAKREQEIQRLADVVEQALSSSALFSAQ